MFKKWCLIDTCLCPPFFFKIWFLSYKIKLTFWRGHCKEHPCDFLHFFVVILMILNFSVWLILKKLYNNFAFSSCYSWIGEHSFPNNLKWRSWELGVVTKRRRAMWRRIWWILTWRRKGRMKKRAQHGEGSFLLEKSPMHGEGGC